MLLHGYVYVLHRSGKKARILDAEGLALGSQIATSKKRARDLMDGSFHRFVCVTVQNVATITLITLDIDVYSTEKHIFKSQYSLNVSVGCTRAAK